MQEIETDVSDLSITFIYEPILNNYVQITEYARMKIVHVKICASSLTLDHLRELTKNLSEKLYLYPIHPIRQLTYNREVFSPSVNVILGQLVMEFAPLNSLYNHPPTVSTSTRAAASTSALTFAPTTSTSTRAVASTFDALHDYAQSSKINQLQGRSIAKNTLYGICHTILKELNACENAPPIDMTTEKKRRKLTNFVNNITCGKYLSGDLEDICHELVKMTSH